MYTTFSRLRLPAPGDPRGASGSGPMELERATLRVGRRGETSECGFEPPAPIRRTARAGSLPPSCRLIRRGGGMARHLVGLTLCGWAGLEMVRGQHADFVAQGAAVVKYACHDLDHLRCRARRWVGGTHHAHDSGGTIAAGLTGERATPYSRPRRPAGWGGSMGRGRWWQRTALRYWSFLVLCRLNRVRVRLPCCESCTFPV